MQSKRCPFEDISVPVKTGVGEILNKHTFIVKIGNISRPTGG